MNKGDRSRTKVARAARAQELLTSRAVPVPTSLASSGFGGYSGSQQIVPTVSQGSAGTSPVVVAHGNIDAEVAQRLRQLSKRDPNTKVKALQALKVLLGERPASEVEGILLAWTTYFQRLVIDNYRYVRIEAGSFMGALAPLAGRNLGKALKSLAGPWWLAQSDPDPECARIFKAAFTQVFPGAKQREALVFCSSQVLDYLERNIKSKPGSLAEVYMEEPEELDERYERVVAASLEAMARMLDVLLPAQLPEVPDEAGKQAVVKLKALLLEDGLLKGLTGTQSPIVIRSSTYKLLALICKRAPKELEGDIKQLSPLVLGGLNDKDPLTHASMWDMVLSFVNAFSAAWKYVDTRKAIVPRLLALLRNACYGSPEVSAPAVLPLVAQMPRDVLGPDPGVMSQLLSAAWQGWQMAGNIGNARAALAQCFTECLAWAMTHSQQLAGESYEAYCDTLLGSASVTANALNITSASNSAADTIFKLAQDLSAPGGSSWTVRLLLTHFEKALTAQLGQGTVPPHRFDRGLMLLQRIAAVMEEADSDSWQEREVWLAELVYKPLREAVLEAFGDQEMPAPAARLLSYLLHPSKNGPKGGADLTPGAALAMYLSGAADGASAVAMADLLLATIQRSANPSQQLGFIATNLACTSVSRSSSSGSISGAADSNGDKSSAPLKLLPSPKLENGHSVGKLLHLHTFILQLLESLKESDCTLQEWRSPRLDAVAHLLLRHEELVSDKRACKVVGALMRGDHWSSLISESALNSALNLLTSYLLDDVLDEGALDRPLAAVSALCVLDAALFSPAVLLDENKEALRPSAVRALVAVFQLDWMYAPPESFIDEENGSQHPAEDPEGTCPPPRLARGCWEDGVRLAEIAKSLAPDQCASIRQALLQSILDGIDQDSSLVQQAVAAAQSIITAACRNADDKDEVLDALLQPRYRWPQYVHLEDAEAFKGKTAAKSTEGRPETLSELAYALGIELGFNAIIYDADGRNRSWLVTELLCFSQQHEHASTDAEVLESFLAEKERLLGLPGVTAARHGLLEGTLDRLLEGAQGNGTGICDVCIYTSALGSLLGQVVTGSDRAVAAGHNFMQSRIAGSRLNVLSTDLLSTVIDSVATTSRGLDGHMPAFEASGLSTIARHQLREAASLPPLMVAVVNNYDMVNSCLESLDLVQRCFPVKDVALLDDGAASTEEKLALIALWQRQITGERAVKAAAAAEKRNAEAGSSTGDQGSRHAAGVREPEAAKALASLSSCVVSYCWRHLKAGHWADLLARTKEGVAAAAVIMEEQAEAVVAEGRKSATAIVSGNKLVAPDIGLAVLRRLSLLSSPEAAQKLQSAAFDMVTELALKKRFEQLRSFGEGWVRVLALVLEANARFAADADLPRDWRQKLTEVLADALRMLFAVGVSMAYIVAAGQRATDMAAMYFEESNLLWTAVARAAEASLPETSCLAESIQTIDAWAAETGVDTFTAVFAVMLAANEHSALQTACLKLLVSPNLLPKVAVPKDDEELEEGDVGASGLDPLYAPLVEAGVHAQVVAVMCGAVCDGCSFPVTWALVLARLLSMESPARRRLSQAFGDSDELITRLMDDLVPLLPLEETTSRRSRGSSAESPAAQQQSAARRAAQAAQMRADGSAWSLTKDLLDLGIPVDEEGDKRLAAALYRGLLFALPASARSWYGRLNNRGLEASIEAYTAAKESPEIISAELGGVSGVAASDVAETAEFRVRASLAAREAVAILSIEESSTLEMAVKLPASWPLRPAEVECRRKVGVAEGRLRKWLLSIAAFLRNQNGTLADAMALWRDNCVREFSGVEECLICYSVVAATNGQLPRLACHTCSKRFHRGCLYKWFRSSGKSVCPHCQSPW